jgi:hypothetical protein
LIGQNQFFPETLEICVSSNGLAITGQFSEPDLKDAVPSWLGCWFMDSDVKPETPPVSVPGNSETAPRPRWSDQLAKAAAILGAFFAVGQTASTIIQGYFQTEAALAKSKQDLELAKQKSDADLASGFLQLILSKDTPDDKRSMLLGALATLKGHPLQEWALERHQEIERNLAKLDQARAARLTALQEKSEADKTVNGLQAQLDEIASVMGLQRDSV